MLESLDHVAELMAAFAVDHTASGGPDLSGSDQVKRGIYLQNPLQRPFVCMAPRGWKDLRGQSTLREWAREYYLDVHAWNRSATDSPEGRIDAAVAMAHVLEVAAQGVFLDGATPSELYLVSHAFRVDEVNILDVTELGGRGPWGFTTMVLAYEVHGRAEGGP